MRPQIHIGTLIKDELYRQGRSATWLARRLFCDRSNIYKLFKKKSMDSELLLRISEILAVNFFEYYSECLEEAGAGCRGVFFAPRRIVARQGSVTHSALWNETEAGEMAKAEPCEAERQKNF